jgi:hypothetical protein
LRFQASLSEHEAELSLTVAYNEQLSNCQRRPYPSNAPAVRFGRVLSQKQSCPPSPRDSRVRERKQVA